MKARTMALALLLLLQTPRAWAVPTAEERARARALMDLGDARFEAKNYASALEQYRAADEIMGVPTTGIEVGRTLERLDRLLEAREALRKVSEYPQRPDEPKPFASARQRADRLLSDIAPRIPRVTLQVDGLPPSTEPTITWDGQAVERSRIGGYLEANPGRHRVVAVASGFPDVARDITLAEGQALQVALTFGQAPAVVTKGETPSRPATPVSPAAPPPARQPVLLWVSVGVAVAGVTVGSVAGARSLSLTKAAKRHCEDTRCTADASEDIDSAKTLANVSNVAFGVGVAALGVATWQFLSHRAKTKEQPRVEARLGWGTVNVAGVF